MPKTLINWICVSSVSFSLTMIWLRYYKKKSNKKFNVMFYNPFNKTNCKCRYNFNLNCPVTTCSSFNTREIIFCLRNAKETIDICMYAISNKTITNEIIAAHSRGVPIRIISSNCVLINSNEIKMLQRINIPIKSQPNPNNSFMHHKFCIVDSTWLIHSSLNWTHQGTFDNWESLLITNSESLIKEFSKCFETMWTNFSFQKKIEERKK